MSYSNLNPEQVRAIKTTKGRVLILAGAGSGKTSVLTHRMAYLIQEEKVSPQQIVGLTFTNKAAREMRERIERILDPKVAKPITLSTFHSFCIHILRKEIHHLGYTPEFSLYSEREIRRLVQLLSRQILEHESELPSVEGVMEKIAHAKSRGAAPEKAKDPFTHDVFEKLEVAMRAYNALDFDSLLTLTVKLFEQFPEVLARYQDRYRYIMIDEYQDTNPIQYRLAELLSRKYNNLCVVGDDDQSIYGWRGAEIKNILNFEADSVIKLEQNYRSTPTILKAANAVIHNNKDRHGKELWSSADRGDPIELFHAPTEKEEAEAVILRILNYRKKKNLAWNEMAILYRSNILSRTLELALLDAAWEDQGTWRRGIPYQVFGGLELYERAEVKDLLAYMRAIANPLDQEAILRIINVPRRGISDNAMDLLTQINRTRDIPLWDVLKEGSSELSDRAAEGVKNFICLIETAREKFQSGKMKASLEWLIETINYKKAIEEEVKSDKGREMKWENVSACIDALSHFEENHPMPSLQEFLATTLLDSSPERYRSFKDDKLNLMTFHSAKGLEFTACFLVAMEDHIIPHEKSLKDRGLEEERRLLYVAMTRAKKYLTLSMARKRKRMGKETNSTPSRFLFEIPKELMKVTMWQNID